MHGDIDYLYLLQCTYRLWYASKGVRQQRSRATMRSTHRKYLSEGKTKMMKQQHLPFTVLKRFAFDAYHIMEFVIVAIVLTVYGIETPTC